MFDYYFNNVPGKGPCRNNLIYTSLINKDQTEFVQWYINDTDYHAGQNQVVDPALMKEKYDREVKYLTMMSLHYPYLVPEFRIDDTKQRIYLRIDGPDFWERSNCTTENYDKVLPDWQEQILNIIKAHKSLGLHKYSMHPSSFFIVNGKLKSINYFFTYHKTEPNICIEDVESHIYSTRQEEIRKNLEKLGIEWNKPQPWEIMDKLCWNSFRTNYPNDFIEKALNV